MPYNRSKGRTHEIPATPSPGPSRLGRSKSTTSIAAVAKSSSHPFDPRQLEAQLEAQIAATQQPQQQRRGSVWRTAVDRVAGFLAIIGWLLLYPFRCVWEAIVCFYQHAPAVVPAGLAMVFLYVGLPLLIAWDYI